MSIKPEIVIDSLSSLKAYRQRAAYLTMALDATESDIESILINTQDLLKRARMGFISQRVNMKSEDGGVSDLNEMLPAIEISCLQIQLKVNEMLMKILTADELPDTVTNVYIQPVNLEDRLRDGL